MRALLFVLILTACGTGADATPPRQVSVIWPEGHRLFVGDSRQGVVRAFSTYDGPRAAGEGRAPGRRGVLDLKLDAARGRLWVLGADALYLHDAATLTLRQRYPVAGVAADSRLALDDSGEAKVVADPAVHDKRASRR
jgi:hypothetical protein